MAVATPFSCTIILNTRTHAWEKRAYGSNLFTNQFRPGDLSLVCCGCDESLSKVLDSQLANTGANAKSLHAISPEELVAEERTNNGRNPR